MEVVGYLALSEHRHCLLVAISAHHIMVQKVEEESLWSDFCCRIVLLVTLTA